MVVKNHPLSRIELCSKDSYIINDGYVRRDTYGFNRNDKCTVLQVMPYTADLLLVEYILDKEIIEEEEKC